MPYVESICKAGKTIEIERYYTSRYKKKGIERGDQVKPTKEEQIKINTNQTIKKLRRLINANFGGGDFHLVLGYKKEERPPNRESMQKDITEFIRKLRKEYRKLGKELKYIYVIEYGKRSARHFHLVINKIDLDIIRKCWSKGRPQIFPLDDSGQYGKLASYLVKEVYLRSEREEGQKRCFTPSKNLVRPIPDIRIINNAKWFQSEAKAQKGYYIDGDSVEKGIHNPEYYGYGFFRYTLVEDPKPKGG